MIFRRLATPLALAALMLSAMPAQAALTWDWSFTDGAAIEASGTFSTADTADAAGWYEITGIAGERNGVAITGLQPTGTAIAGNEPYAVDNLVRASGVQLTGNGFGFTTADGNASNPFYADFLAVPGYLEFHSIGPDGASSTELEVSFSAHISSVPEPGITTLLVTGLLALAWARGRRG